MSARFAYKPSDPFVSAADEIDALIGRLFSNAGFKKMSRTGLHGQILEQKAELVRSLCLCAELIPIEDPQSPAGEPSQSLPASAQN